MSFTANFQRVPIQFEDDYLQKYVVSGTLDTREINHRFQRQIVGVITQKTTKSGKSHNICTPHIVIDVGATASRVPNHDDPVRVPYLRLHKVGTERTRVSLTLHNHKFMWDIPRLGVINYKDSVVFTHLGAARQWRRGLDPTALTFDDPLALDNRYVRQTLGNNQRFLNRDEVIKSIYQRVEFDFNQAYEQVSNFTRRAAAFNSKFFIANTVLSGSLVIGYRNTLVGIIGDDGTIILNPEAAFLLESLSEYRPCKIRGIQK